MISCETDACWRPKRRIFSRLCILNTFSRLYSSSSSSLLTTICRLAVCYLGDRGVDSTGRGYVNPYPGYGIPNHTHVRLCQFFFFGYGCYDWQQIKSLSKGFKLLTVLDLEKARLSYGYMLPTAIGNLRIFALFYRQLGIPSNPRFIRDKYWHIRIPKCPVEVWTIETSISACSSQEAICR